MNNVLAYFPIDDRCKFIFLTFLNFRLGRGIQIGLCRCNSSLQNSNHQLFHLCIYIYPQHNVASRPEHSQVQSRFLVYCFLCICTVGKMLLTFGRLINHFWTFIAVLDGLVWLCTIICILSFLYFFPVVCLWLFTFLGLQVTKSNAVNGHIILLLSLHKHRSISPLGHKSITALKECSLTSTSTFGALLQKQNPRKME